MHRPFLLQQQHDIDHDQKSRILDFEHYLQTRRDVAVLQGHLFRAMMKAKLIPDPAPSWQELNYSRCGRTDKGVSAAGQVSLLCFCQPAPDAEPKCVKVH